MAADAPSLGKGKDFFSLLSVCNCLCSFAVYCIQLFKTARAKALWKSDVTVVDVPVQDSLKINLQSNMSILYSVLSGYEEIHLLNRLSHFSVLVFCT